VSAWERLTRLFTGPTQAELEAAGLKPASEQPPLYRDPVPYKKGRTEAQWPKTPKPTTLLDRIKALLKRS